ncbi:MAG TPA: peptidoglycan-binding domain-containing protein [Pyrinomonadaceae bacterium]|jgi:hypothetical protein
MPPAPPSPFAVHIPNVTVGMPFLRRGKPAEMFAALRAKIIKEAGFDFLSVFGDMMRGKNFHTNKPGASNKSRHMCGDAFDYNQGEARAVVIQEPRGPNMYFRSYLRCAKQDGTQGKKLALPAATSPAKFYVDFTMIAEALGWHRIRAQSGWQQTPTKREHWHYQYTEGYSFDEAMALLYGNHDAVPVQPEYPAVARGARDDEAVFHVRRDVRQVQAQLYLLNHLQSIKDVDGGFGQQTEDAVKAFQQQAGLPVTGIADTTTRKALLQQVL